MIRPSVVLFGVFLVSIARSIVAAPVPADVGGDLWSANTLTRRANIVQLLRSVGSSPDTRKPVQVDPPRHRTKSAHSKNPPASVESIPDDGISNPAIPPQSGMKTVQGKEASPRQPTIKPFRNELDDVFHAKASSLTKIIMDTHKALAGPDARGTLDRMKHVREAAMQQRESLQRLKETVDYSRVSEFRSVEEPEKNLKWLKYKGMASDAVTAAQTAAQMARSKVRWWNRNGKAGTAAKKAEEHAYRLADGLRVLTEQFEPKLYV